MTASALLRIHPTFGTAFGAGSGEKSIGGLQTKKAANSSYPL
jgi:hypothetical protein